MRTFRKVSQRVERAVSLAIKAYPGRIIGLIIAPSFSEAHSHCIHYARRWPADGRSSGRYGDRDRVLPLHCPLLLDLDPLFAAMVVLPAASASRINPSDKANHSRLTEYSRAQLRLIDTPPSASKALPVVKLDASEAR